MAAETEKSPLPAQRERTPLYTVARCLASFLTHTLFPVRYHHTDVLSMDAPYILISNHLSLLDPFAVALPCKKYEIRFLGKKELTKNKLLGYLVVKIHMIPVERHHSDLAAMRECLKVLKAGKVLGIFPEGSRHHEDLMTPIESGTAMLALRANVPLIPVYLDRKLKLFRRVNAFVGDPIDLSAYREQGIDSAQVEAASQKIRETFFTMREHAKINA